MQDICSFLTTMQQHIHPFATFSVPKIIHDFSVANEKLSQKSRVSVCFWLTTPTTMMALHIPLHFVWMNSLHEDSKTGCAFITQEMNATKTEHNFTGPQDQWKDFQNSTLSNWGYFSAGGACLKFLHSITSQWPPSEDSLCALKHSSNRIFRMRTACKSFTPVKSMPKNPTNSTAFFASFSKLGSDVLFFSYV